MHLPGRLHHIELNVSSLQVSLKFWKPLLERFAYVEYQAWDSGRSYKLDDTYIVFVRASESLSADRHDRRRVGLNHLAFSAASRQQVDEITLWIAVRFLLLPRPVVFGRQSPVLPDSAECSARFVPDALRSCFRSRHITTRRRHTLRIRVIARAAAATIHGPLCRQISWPTLYPIDLLVVARADRTAKEVLDFLVFPQR